MEAGDKKDRELKAVVARQGAVKQETHAASSDRPGIKAARETGDPEEAGKAGASGGGFPNRVSNEEAEKGRRPPGGAELDAGEVAGAASAAAEDKPPAVRALLARSADSLPSIGASDDPIGLIKLVRAAHARADVDAIDRAALTSLVEIGRNPVNLNRSHHASILQLSKNFPEAFALPSSFEVLLGWLRTSSGPTTVPDRKGVKRQVPLLPLLACRLLHAAWAEVPEWPLDLVKAYLDDAANARQWVDNEACREFVAGIVTAFPETPTEPSEGGGLSRDPPPGVASSITPFAGEGSSRVEVKPSVRATRNRYPRPEVRQVARSEMLGTLDRLVAQPGAKENPRQLGKLLMQGAGYEEVRLLGSTLLEQWLNSPNHLRSGKAVMERILQLLEGTSENDFNTVANLLSLRIKALQTRIFPDMLSQLVRKRPEYAALALKTFMLAEAHSKNIHNVKSIATVIKAMPTYFTPEQELANILQQLAADVDLRSQLRGLVRRLLRGVGTDTINACLLCRGLMRPCDDVAGPGSQLAQIQQWILQIADLICLVLTHAAIPFTGPEERQGYGGSMTAHLPGSAAVHGSTAATPESLRQFRTDVMSVQSEAMAWCAVVAARLLRGGNLALFPSLVRRLLFLDPPDYLQTGEAGPGNEASQAPTPAEMAAKAAETAALRLLVNSIPVPEEVIAHIVLMGISDEYQLPPPDALSIVEALLRRAAALTKVFQKDGSERALCASNVQLSMAVFRLGLFPLLGQSLPPPSATPPLDVAMVSALAPLVGGPDLLSVRPLFWRACIAVTLLAALALDTIGRHAWQRLPTVRCLMEGLITRTRCYPSDALPPPQKNGPRKRPSNLRKTAPALRKAAVARNRGGGEEGGRKV